MLISGCHRFTAQGSPVAATLQLRPSRHCCYFKPWTRSQRRRAKQDTRADAYRWSPEGPEQRRRESLLDNVEPAERPDSYRGQGRAAGSEPDTNAASQWQDAAAAGPSQPGAGRDAADSSDTGRDVGASSGTAPDDESGWGRPARAPTDDWGWPEASAAGEAAEGAWKGAEPGPGSRGYAARGAAQNRAGDGGWREAAGDRPGWEADGEPPQDDWDGEAVPDITLLTPQERDRVLPLSPFREQVEFFRGDAAQNVQRLGGAVLVTILAASKAAVLAAGALTFPFWWPWLQAAKKNGDVKTQYGYVGLWRAEVMESEVVGRRPASFTADLGERQRRRGALQPTLELLVGDSSGARAHISVPYDRRLDSIRIGEPAELLVVSKGATFYSFKALQEAYLPESGAWLARYPFVDKDVFLDISLDVERERRQQDAEQDGEQGAGPY